MRCLRSRGLRLQSRGVLLFTLAAWQLPICRGFLVEKSIGFSSSSRGVTPIALPVAPLFDRLGPSVAVEPRDVLPPKTLKDIEAAFQKRSEARWDGNYKEADAALEQLQATPLPDGYVLKIEDLPRSKGGGSTWQLVYRFLGDGEAFEGPSVLQLAHAALGLAVSSSEQMTPLLHTQRELDPIVQQTKDVLLEWKATHGKMKDGSILIEPSQPAAEWREIETTLRGRTSADAAFWLALAGVRDQDLLELLADVCVKELERFGANSSCRVKDIIQMMDRFAASGVQHENLEHIAKTIIADKASNDDIKLLQEDSLLDFHSDRCLLMLWKFATRQKKQQSFLKSAMDHWETSRDTNDYHRGPPSSPCPSATIMQIDWLSCFDDPSRRLVIDIGCGMGISLLGLASLDSKSLVSEPSSVFKHARPEEEFNYLGVDLSGLTIGYALGMSHRRGLSGHLHYVVGTAESLLEQITSYPGQVAQVLIQFPTPYRLPTNSTAGNSQLPSSALEGFMVSPNLLRQLYTILSKSNGKLLLQSNCEDVAVWMQNAARAEGFVSLEMEVPRIMDEMKRLDLRNGTQRTQNWVAMGGERAIGPSFFRDEDQLRPKLLAD